MPHKDPEARRAYHRAYKQAHRSEEKSRLAQWHKDHPEARRETQKRYFQKHRQKILTYSKQYREKNQAYYQSLKKEYYQLPGVKARIDESTKQLRAKHPDRYKAYSKKYYTSYPEKHRSKNRDYYHDHKEELKVKRRNWLLANPEKNAQYLKQRRARKLGVRSTLTHAQWLIIQEHQKHRCAYCGILCKGRLTQDHITPLIKGGSHTLHNVIGACRSCNSRKRTGPPPIPVQPLLL